jgi:hypothetical protein
MTDGMMRSISNTRIKTDIIADAIRTSRAV